MNPIKERIVRCLTGKEDCPMEVYMEIVTQAQAEFIPMGVEADADAILIAKRAKGAIFIAGLVGKSVIHGPELQRYAEAYFADEGGLDLHSPKIADYLYNDIKGKSEAIMVLATGDRRFRSFRPLKNIDEVLAGSINS